MTEEENRMALERKVVRCARLLRQTEKSAMCATGEEKETANTRHWQAKAAFRDAVDRLIRSDP
jgi:hypothetical protein